MINNNEWKLSKHVERLPWLLLFPRRGILRLHNISINHPFKNLVMIYPSLQNTCNIGQTNVSKTKRWKSIPASSRSMDQIKLLMVEILNPILVRFFERKSREGRRECEMRPRLAKGVWWFVIKGSTPWSMASTSLPRETPGSARELDAMIHGVETCNLDAMLHGVNPLGPNLDLSHPGV